MRYFSRLRGYTTLVFDNRGVGHSDSPKGAYRTSDLAMDTVELLKFIGWIDDDENEGGEVEKNSLNVVGVSMGGMIAQELVSFF